jgi:glycosyltransferase involved in cell wall biosynthesis
MNLLVNTLSIGSMSGNHVVYGFLRPYSEAILPEHRLQILHYESDPPPAEILSRGAIAISLPNRYKHWVKRTVWETIELPKLIRRSGADVVLTVSGALLPRCPVPQAVLCQNPWCYRPIVHRNFSERLKAHLQRHGYGKAFRHADLMLYISEHLRQLYAEDNSGKPETAYDIAYVGLNADTYDAAQRSKHLPRDPYSILSVSAMANWKGAHTLVDAVGILRQRDIPATLRLVGPWPEPAYEARVRQQIGDRGLAEAVQILGRVSNEELHRQYAVNQVYALASHCESFGIPAAEAMAFGTPVVSTTCCAISEICRPAGKFGPVEDANWFADALQELLTDQQRWQQLSCAARQRAATLTWENCFRPFLKIESLAKR